MAAAGAATASAATTAALAAMAIRTLSPLGLIVVSLGSGRDALAEGVLLVLVRAVLLGERGLVGVALLLAGLGGVDAGLGRRLDGLLGRRRDALAQRVPLVLAGAVLLGERGRVGVAFGLACLGGVLQLGRGDRRGLGDAGSRRLGRALGGVQQLEGLRAHIVLLGPARIAGKIGRRRSRATRICGHCRRREREHRQCCDDKGPTHAELLSRE